MLTAIRSTCVNEGKGFYYSVSVSITIPKGFAKSFRCYFVLYTYQVIVLTVHLVSTLFPSPRGNPPVFPSGRKGILSFAPLNWGKECVRQTAHIMYHLPAPFFFFFLSLEEVSCQFLRPREGDSYQFHLVVFLCLMKPVLSSKFGPASYL